jgi:predicted transcriptional regulator
VGALIELVLTHPIASAGMIAKELGVPPRAAQNLIAELGLREVTGRSRYRGIGRGGLPKRLEGQSTTLPKLGSGVRRSL